MKLFNNYSCIPLVLILSTVACSPIKIKSEKITQNPAIITAVPQEDLSLAGNLPVNSEKQTLDSWQHLISIFELSDVSNPRIERELKWFLAHPSSVNKFQTRAEPYIYNIIEEVKAKNLPAEFALLPAIESGYRAHAYSHSAAGLWQFIPSTGRAFKLEQNWWYDGRRDVHASTKAETKYLKQLAKRFDNDWLLALAAYNAGGGNVNRAVRRNREKNKVTDYWSLKLPNETQHYVPKLLALAKLFANAEEYGITLKKLEHKPYFSIVNIGSQLDLAKAAELSAMSIDDIFQINPGFNRGFTPPKGPHRLLIPVDKVSQFEENLALLPDTQRVKWQRHKIKSGENLSVIAQHYKIKTSVLRNVNHIKTTKLGAPFLLHETLGCPIANLHSARSDLWEPPFVLRPTQLRKKHCFVKSTSNDLTAVGITTCLPCELTSTLRIGEFPCRLLRTKNHHFAALIFSGGDYLCCCFIAFIGF
jgi:membrane-bound lytic murein transglycosylase D